jgi:hypothetical protein
MKNGSGTPLYSFLVPIYLTSSFLPLELVAAGGGAGADFESFFLPAASF